MTIEQINEYVSSWSQQKEDTNSSFDDIELFNLNSGIETIVRNKK